MVEWRIPLMSKVRREALLIAALLVCASMLAATFKPTRSLADHLGTIDIKAEIPARFGDWRVDEDVVPTMVTPALKEKLDAIYSQLVNRTYVNTAGQRVMLSIAYGRDQRDSLAVHYPDVCYPTQGFQVVSRSLGKIQTKHGTIDVKRMEAMQAHRYEPVTYWMMIGDYHALNGVDKKIAEMRYGINGIVPDGLMFRVSSIDRDSKNAFIVQGKFVSDLVSEMLPSSRRRISGL